MNVDTILLTPFAGLLKNIVAKHPRNLKRMLKRRNNFNKIAHNKKRFQQNICTYPQIKKISKKLLTNFP